MYAPGLREAGTTTHGVEERPEGRPRRGEARSAEYSAAQWIYGDPENKYDPRHPPPQALSDLSADMSVGRLSLWMQTDKPPK
jgi:hypothetical protein